MYFIDKKLHLIGFQRKNYLNLKTKSILHMDNYLIMLGMYLILMIFVKVYVSVATKD